MKENMIFFMRWEVLQEKKMTSNHRRRRLTAVYRAINKLFGISWFKEAVRDIRVFNVEDWSDFTEIVKQN